MAHVRKYAHLLDIDDAPDVYESPEAGQGKAAAGDNSPHSDSDSEYEDGKASTGISRSRLKPNNARDRFDSSRVDASNADFSDRVVAKKQSYTVTTRRRLVNGTHDSLKDGGEDHSSEDEGDEGLARRIARLNREIEEVKLAIRQRDADGIQEGTKGTDQGETGEVKGKATISDGDITALTRALETVQESQRQAVSAHAQLQKQLAAPFPRLGTLTSTNASTATSDSQAPIDAETLRKLAAFDTRLASLETALGLNALDLSDPSTASVLPLLPTLSLLDQQVALLTSADSVPNLEAKLGAVRALDSLPSGGASEKATIAAAGPSGKDGPVGADDGSVHEQLTAEDVAQLRALHGLAPTLRTLSPTIGPLLARLQSLRHLHSAAAGAGKKLEDLERRQDETDKEIGRWREGLDRLGGLVEQAEQGWKGNIERVEGLVAELEGRVKDLDNDA